ncbi:MAG: hypothetical protein MI867_17705 [Pseudomonadales bacterium]|nr:hypothetical protein [Pseudomonadales bacterium]
MIGELSYLMVLMMILLNRLVAWERLCGEFGFCGIVPIVTESCDIAKYSAVE